MRKQIDGIPNAEQTLPPPRLPGFGLPKVPPASRPPVILPGDTVRIVVYRQPDLTMEVRIPRNGKFTYPLIGKVQAAGLTASALEEEIRNRLSRDFLRDPIVMVTITQYAQRRVYLMGGVKSPGAYPVEPTERVTLLQLIASAGGLDDKAVKERVTIVRRTSGDDREVIRLSLVALEKEIEKGNPAADLEMYPDDLVVIPTAARVVHVLGAVNAQGWIALPVDGPVTVSMAISRAGGFTKYASSSRILVLRKNAEGETVKIRVNLDRIVKGDLDADLRLEPGDVIWVPERGLF